MKQHFLKISLASMLLISPVAFVSCSGDNPTEVETTITVKELPQKAQDFLYMNFHGYEVEKVEKDVEDNIILYFVTLEEGYEIVFNNEGDWQQVDAPYGKTIPTGFIPETVMSTLNQRFPGYGLNEINTTGEGYKVELSDNQGGASIDVFFNMSGEIIGIDELD